MATQITEVDLLREYLDGVVNRAGHHAKGVQFIVLALVGAVVLHKDRDVPIETRGEPGDFKNVLWVTIRGTRYAFSYNHEASAIDVRRGSLQGNSVAQFTDANTVGEVAQAFENL